MASEVDNLQAEQNGTECLRALLWVMSRILVSNYDAVSRGCVSAVSRRAGSPRMTRCFVKVRAAVAYGLTAERELVHEERV